MQRFVPKRSMQKLKYGAVASASSEEFGGLSFLCHPKPVVAIESPPSFTITFSHSASSFIVFSKIQIRNAFELDRALFLKAHPRDLDDNLIWKRFGKFKEIFMLWMIQPCVERKAIVK